MSIYIIDHCNTSCINRSDGEIIYTPYLIDAYWPRIASLYTRDNRDINILTLIFNIFRKSASVSADKGDVSCRRKVIAPQTSRRFCQWRYYSLHKKASHNCSIYSY